MQYKTWTTMYAVIIYSIPFNILYFKTYVVSFLSYIFLLSRHINFYLQNKIYVTINVLKYAWYNIYSTTHSVQYTLYNICRTIHAVR